jgi:3-oxoacyl-[acyl-carrier protein] reductase
MDLGLAGRVALITGGSRGIGRATALAYAREGARVAITYASDEQRARATAEEIEAGRPAEGDEIEKARAGGPDAAAALPMDLEDPATIAAAADAVRERWGGLDCLVANAVRWPDPAPRFEDTPAAVWQPAVRANLEGTIATLQAFLPLMRGRPDGRIVLVSSDVARHGFPGSGFYGAAKAGLGGLMAALIEELRGEILVNVVSPGFTVTERNLELMPQTVRDEVAARTPTRRLSTPEDIAAAAVFLGSPANRNIAGAVLDVTGGL